MAVGTAKPEMHPIHKPGATLPISIGSDWQAVNTAPTTTDNSTNTVVNPGGITRAEITKLHVGGYGTTAQVRLRYDNSPTPTVSPVVQCFGQDGAGNWQRLVNINGTHEVTLTIDETNNVNNGTYGWTDAEATFAEFDLKGCQFLLVAVKTAFAATTTTNGRIEARILN